MLRQLWTDVRYRLRAIFRRSKMEDELDTELRFHLEREAEELERRRGVSRADAERLARVEFGGLELTKEQAREARGTALLEQLLQDARYACRTLRKEPAFTLTIVLLLGLGIGANTATFSVMQALLFRPLAVPHAEDLVIIGKPSAVGSNWSGPPQTDYVSFPLYEDVRSRARGFADIYAAGRLNGAEVSLAGRPAEGGGITGHTEVRLVTGNYFDVLQVPAARGRTFASAPAASRAITPVAVVSDGYWQRRFARDPSAVGSAISVNHVPLTIIGVMPAGFGDIVGSATDIWIPIGMQPLLSPDQKMLDDRRSSWLQMMGRLAPGVTLAQAKAAIPAIEAEAVRAQLSAKDLVQFESNLHDDPIEVGSGALGFSRFRRDYKAPLIVVMCAVGLIVLIVCANVANLMLVRAVARAREMSVRMALGAGRRRLLRQLLTETLLLAGAGGALGVLASRPGSKLLVSLANSPISLDTAGNGIVLGFAAALTLGCAILFGLVPAFRGTQVDLAIALRAQGRSLIGARTRVGRLAAGKALVVVQLTLSVVLLIGAGLLIRSMQRLVAADLGFDRDRLVVLKVFTQKAGYTLARTQALADTLPDRVRALPGVIGAGTTFHGFFGSHGFISLVPPAHSNSTSPRDVKYDAVGPGYFRAIGATLLRGREFDARDSASGAKVAIVNQSLARSVFGAANPIGSTLRDDEDTTYTIVGVVGDMREASVRAVRVQEVYLPFSQTHQNGFWLAVRVNGDAAASLGTIERAVHETDAALPLEVHAVKDLAAQSVAEDRLTMRVTAFFGIVALLLAAFGLYGLIAYETTRRTGEFGLRMALGAEPGSVARAVLGESAALCALGLACGIPAGLAAAGLIRDQIFGVGRVDPPSLVAAVGILIVTTLLAAYLPARRAARIAPIEALRTE
jgi:predicted permease